MKERKKYCQYGVGLALRKIGLSFQVACMMHITGTKLQLTNVLELP